MTVASLIERLKQVPTHQNTPEKTPGVLVKNEAVRGENRQNTPNTPNTPEKAGGQSANQKLPPSWTAPAPLPDPGLPRLLSAVATLCDATKASDAERADWLADMQAALPERRGDLLALVQRLTPQTRPVPTVVPEPAPKPLPQFHHAQPWREADRAFQAHYWQCSACKAGGRSRGPLCPTGEQLQQAIY